MTPSKTIYDQVDCLKAHPCASGDGALALTIGVSGLDFRNKLGGKLLGVPPSNDRLIYVLLVGHPSKVSCRIVNFIKVPVMDIWKSIWVGDEGCGNETGHQEAFLLTVPAKDEVPVSGVVYGAGKYLTAPKHGTASCLVWDKTVKASDSSKIGDFIKSFVSEDRKPSFTIAHLNLHARGLFSAWHPMMQARGGI